MHPTKNKISTNNQATFAKLTPRNTVKYHTENEKSWSKKGKVINKNNYANIMTN